MIRIKSLRVRKRAIMQRNQLLHSDVRFTDHRNQLLREAVAVLGTARPEAENICGAPTPGKKFGPNIIFCVL